MNKHGEKTIVSIEVDKQYCKTLMVDGKKLITIYDML